MSALTFGPSLFIQPHYDDVPLSCGGTVALLADRGDHPHMVTVFAGEVVNEMVGEFAAWKHERWKVTDTEQVLSVRRAEDADAARALGCPVRWLGMPDAIYRGDRYKSDPELFGALKGEELELAAHLADELRHLPERRDDVWVFVPLEVGFHVDHQLVFEAGRYLASQGAEVYAYEDCPYAIHTPAGFDRRLAVLGDAVGDPVIVPIGEEALQRRLEAIGCYRSQVPVIFRFTSDFRTTVTEFAQKTGEGAGPAERFWPVRPHGGYL
jgi:LmbE family N-acetylglucosaminyl deacetylase